MTDDPFSLSNLHDIIEPAPIPFWPPAPGVWLILALIVLWAVALSVMWWIRWRRNAYRRAALIELDVLKSRFETLDTRASTLQELSALLKRTALAAYPRETVASLSGDKWLSFLDQTAGDRGFPLDAGRLIGAGMYNTGLVSQADQSEIENLISLSRSWIVRHRVISDN